MKNMQNRVIILLIIFLVIFVSSSFSQTKLTRYFYAEIVRPRISGELLAFTLNSSLIANGYCLTFDKTKFIECLTQDSLLLEKTDLILDPNNYAGLFYQIKQFLPSLKLNSSIGFTLLYTLDFNPIINISNKEYVVIKLTFIGRKLEYNEKLDKLFKETNIRYNFSKISNTYVFDRLIKIETVDEINDYIKTYKYNIQ